MNKAALRTHMHIFLGTCFLYLGYTPRSGTMDNVAQFASSVYGNTNLFSKVLCHCTCLLTVYGSQLL